MRNRRMLVIVIAATAFSLLGVVPAFAGSVYDSAWVNHWETDYTGTNDWWNPCTNQSTVITSVTHYEGTFVFDANGVDHGTNHAKLVEGSDDHGWVATALSVNRSQSGIRNTSDGAYSMWQLHITMEDPDTGQRYKAVLTVRGVWNANLSF